MVFALNLSLQPNESASVVTADAEDAEHRHYNLEVEYVGKLSGQEWLTAAVLKLNQNLGDVGDALIQITYQNVTSNRVRVGIGHVGGGLADDPGAAPTPAPPYTLSGQITWAGLALSGVAVNLGGLSTASATTNDNGAYSFTVTSAGDFSITPAKRFFTFTPVTILLSDLANSRTVNFSAVRDIFVISGVTKDDQGGALDGVTVKLESSGGGAARITTTAGGGNFSFADVPAGFDYTVTPTITSLFAFTPQSVSELTQNLAFTFNGVLRAYTISGFISDRAQRGVSGVNVTLSGAATRSTTTDANGNYSFSNLLAGRNYSVSAAKTDHYVNPASQNFNLLKDERADFSAIRFYIISGRVTDNSGRGLWNILMSLTGPESVSARTTSDGLFSFIVTTSGNYLLTPSREQDFYQFSPANQSLLNLSDHQTINFTAAIVVVSPTYVLEFDGTPKTVDYSFFWPPDTNVGPFFWEFWAMPGNDSYARYMLSDGYGGAHALLFGFNYGPPGHYTLMGNIWNGTEPFYFNSDDGPSPGEWGHFAVGWDGQNIITYYDGVPVGKQPFTGPRVSTGLYNGATMLLIGGSNHQNFIGRIAQVRGYEENNPRANSPESSFVPQTIFSSDGQVLSYYFRPASIVADLSFGYNGVHHDGWPRGMLLFYFYGCDGCPTPQFVLDPTAPDFASPNNPGQTNTLIDAPPPAPGGARLFDSFSRNNSTHILNSKGGLGDTETGAGTWRTNIDSSQPQPFGILSGRAVLLGDSTALAWVPVATTTGNLDVRVDRARGNFGSGANTGMCFRVTDKNNFFFAFTSDDQSNLSGPKKLTVGYYQAGLRNLLADGITLPSQNWTTLRAVTTHTGGISIYVDNALLYSTTNSFNADAGGAGLFNHGPGMSLQNRWDNFTVFEVP
jgi:hypothetical protein